MDMATQMIENPTSADQRPTALITDASDLRNDPFAVLDHRFRAKAMLAADALPGHYLSISDADGVEHLLALEDAITHVGRATAADLRFDDVHVSRRHAIIVRYGNHVRVLDDRSSTGTFVNGRRIIATDLLERDVVRLGPIVFTYLRVR
jgi:pSer/pThr/pTyr-binding forkhead associated (FHA) protein